MKKSLSLILVLLLIITSSVAFAADYSTMTEEQLKTQYDLIRNELLKRGLKAEKKTIIVEQKGVQIYVNGDITIEKEYSWDDTYYLFIPVVVVNNTTKTLNIIVGEASINGWSTDASAYSVGAIPAGKKSKGSLKFELEDTDVESLDDFEDVEFTIRMYDDNTWDDLFKTKPITIYPSK